jgi:hypothetical protein
MTMSWKKRLLIAVLVLLGIYLLTGTTVALRRAFLAPPQAAALKYLQALRDRDAAAIYLYSDMLGPHLAGMMDKSDLSEEQRQNLWAKDFARWKMEYDRGSEAEDALRRERALLPPSVQIVATQAEDYKAEVHDGISLSLASYNDVPGMIHHRYFQLVFGAESEAPLVSVLENIHTGPQRRIKSVVVRVEVQRRPDVGWFRSVLAEWDWLEEIGFLFPRVTAPPEDPSDFWMAGLSFDVDKLTLETY